MALIDEIKHTKQGATEHTHSQLTLKDLEALVEEMEKAKPLLSLQLPFTIPMHLNEHVIPFWHEEGYLQHILDNFEIFINSAGHDMLVELGYIKNKEDES